MSLGRRHRRRRFRGYVSIPGFGTLPSLRDLNPLKRSVTSTDVLLGLALGVAGGGAVRMGLNKTDFGAKLPQWAKNNIFLLSSAVAGYAAWFFLKKNHRGQGLLTGALAAGLAPWVINTVSQKFPSLAGYTTVGVPGATNAFAGQIVRNPRLSGVIMKNPRLDGLGRMAVDPEAYEGVAAAMGQ